MSSSGAQVGLSEWYRQLSAQQRTTYLLLLAVIVLTIPCYCLALAALSLAPATFSLTPTPIATPPLATPQPTGSAMVTADMPDGTTQSQLAAARVGQPVPARSFLDIVPGATADPAWGVRALTTAPTLAQPPLDAWRSTPWQRF